ncbi:MAG: GDSL-type esterase/lipase family protein [Candidatus Micrarchaeota archaeon]
MKAVALIVLAVLFMGCAGQQAPEAPESQAGTQSPPDAPAAGEGGTGADGDAAPQADSVAETPSASQAPPDAGGTVPGGDAGPGNDEVLLLGRSVGYGWAGYMGLEYDDATGTYNGTYGGNSIRYMEVAGPPDIAGSATDALDEYDSGVVFFKLCFVDFGSESGESLAEDEQYVQAVYEEAVTKRGRKLVVGNALPQLASSTTPGMRYNHEKYNEWLSQFAASHDGIYVLDLYGALADGSGNLRPEYAASPDDSHLNGKGYAAITPALMDAIGQARAG